MPSDCVSYKDSGYFSPLIIDYLDRSAKLDGLYNRHPTLDNFKDQIADKSANYLGDRNVLADVLSKQYQSIEISKLTRQNIDLLRHEKTFTVTTGHQLNLFTGPLYFLYKIVTAINLAKKLKNQYPENHFVPMYWMATEDHDFDEINYFSFRGVKYKWNRDASGAVGRLSTEGLERVFSIFEKELGQSDHAEELRQLFERAYLSGQSLANATRILADELFGRYGLVIIDADDYRLKSFFVAHIESELTNNISYSEVLKTSEKLTDYNIQVNPREINLFYLDGGFRERIIYEDEKFLINNTKLIFSKEEILELVRKHPERFSPNVIMRPLYQEVILPNLCYIGGGGEIAYWLELNSFFEKSDVTFPILLLRNSAVLTTEKQALKADKLMLSWKDLFLKQDELVSKMAKSLSALETDFSKRREFLQAQFAELKETASKTDKSFGTAVAAQESKQLKGLDNLEKKLLRAEKKMHADALHRITELQNQLFPNKSLQERNANFAEFYLHKGSALIDLFMDNLDPLSPNFSILKI